MPPLPITVTTRTKPSKNQLKEISILKVNIRKYADFSLTPEYNYAVCSALGVNLEHQKTLGPSMYSQLIDH